MKSNKSKVGCKRGFTFIELLVVVLIIGILAAVAVPQYKKVVEQSKASEALHILKSIYHAAEVYYVANGTWPAQFSQLDVDIPWTGNVKWHDDIGGLNTDTRSNKDWSLQLYNVPYLEPPQLRVSIARISGPYAGAGFVIWKSVDTEGHVLRQIECIERKSVGIVFQGNSGDYCHKVLNWPAVVSGSGSTFYKIPY